MNLNLEPGTYMIRGDFLPLEIQRDARRRYDNRFTRDHVPAWAKQPRPDGSPYPVQFASDQEWITRTLFRVRILKNGSICQKSGTWGDCMSYPSWPDGMSDADKSRGFGQVNNPPEYIR